MNMSRIAFVAVFTFIAVCGTAALLPRGAAPQFAHLYDGAAFQCFDGSKQLPHAAVNDDYCDCPDGSDEPGTSACPNGKFFCLNDGYQSQFVPSSRVNDGICDCCDGSDEYAGATCVNNCDEIGREWRAEQERLKKVHAEGARVYAEYVRLGAIARQKWQQELDASQELLKVARVAEEQKRAARDEAVALETSEKDALRERLTTEAEAAAAATPEPPAQPAAVAEVVDDATGAAEKPAESEADTHKKKIDQEVDSYRNADADAARDAYSQAEQTASMLARDVADLEKKLQTDYGSSSQFQQLAGQCFSLKTREYEYEMCPFDEVRQKTNTGSTTSLGRWKGFENNYTDMLFDGGLRCWGGPDRSARVHLTCGSQSELISAEEPAKCEYVFKFSTPALCAPADVHRSGTDGVAVE